MTTFQTIQEAYTILSNPHTRSKYDRWLKSNIGVPFEEWERLSGGVTHWSNPIKIKKQIEEGNGKEDEKDLGRRKFKNYEI
jgi:DnaJ-class molecular chaperone